MPARPQHPVCPSPTLGSSPSAYQGEKLRGKVPSRREDRKRGMAEEERVKVNNP